MCPVRNVTQKYAPIFGCVADYTKVSFRGGRPRTRGVGAFEVVTRGRVCEYMCGVYYPRACVRACVRV